MLTRVNDLIQMPESAEIVVIHTNDMHGRLTPGAADRLRALLAAHPGALLLDAGDAISAGNLGVRLGGEPILRQMTDLGYAAMTLGNRETHPRREAFPRKIADAGFPLLCANVTARPGAALPVRPSLEVEINGLRVGVFGVTVPMFTRKMWSAAVCDYFFDKPIPAALSVAAELRSRCEVVIALTHLGFRRDLELARSGLEADLIIGGHSHTDLTEPCREGDVPIVQARSHAFFAGVARLRIGEGDVRLTDWRKVPLRDDAPASPGD